MDGYPTALADARSHYNPCSRVVQRPQPSPLHITSPCVAFPSHTLYRHSATPSHRSRHLPLPAGPFLRPVLPPGVQKVRAREYHTQGTFLTRMVIAQAGEDLTSPPCLKASDCTLHLPNGTARSYLHSTQVVRSLNARVTLAATYHAGICHRTRSDGKTAHAHHCAHSGSTLL